MNKGVVRKSLVLGIIILMVGAGIVQNIKTTVKADPSGGMVGYWSFDDGTATDQSGYSNHGIKYGGPTIVTGVSGNALSFDGVDDWIDCGNDESLNPSTAITLAAWYKPTISWRGAGNDPIIDKPFNSNKWYSFYQYHLGICGDLYPTHTPLGVEFDTAAGGIWRYTGAPPNSLSFNQWSFIVGTYDGSTMKCYINGILISSKLVSGTISNYGQNLRIAKYLNYLSQPTFLPGIIDEVRIYNRAISADEIQFLYDLNSEPSSSIILQPSSQDSYVDKKNPDNDQPIINYGSLQFMDLLSTPGDGVTRFAYVQFDTSIIPSGKIIETATLSLRCTSLGSSASVKVYEASSGWNENTVTYNTGPEWYMTPVSSYYVASTGWCSWDVTEHVKDWYSGARSNFGFVVIQQEAITHSSQFATKEYTNSAYRPKLEITFANSGLDRIYFGKYHNLVVPEDEDSAPYINPQQNSFSWDEYPTGTNDPLDYATVAGEPVASSRAEVASVVTNYKNLYSGGKVIHQWYKKSNNELLFTYEVTIPNPQDSDHEFWGWYTVYSWIGKFPWEISEPGDYYVHVSSPWNDDIIYFTVVSAGLEDIDLVTMYTTKTNGDYERVFKYDSEFNIVTVVKNKGINSVTIDPGDFIIKIKDLYDDTYKATLPNIDSYSIPPGENSAIIISWNCNEGLAKWAAESGSGFTFYGKKFEANVLLGRNTLTYEFFIDEYGIPDKLRDIRWLGAPSLNKMAGEYNNFKTQQNIEDYFNFSGKRTSDLYFNGFNYPSEFLYEFGGHESNQRSPIKYWLPASSDDLWGSDATYNTPNNRIYTACNSNLEGSRNFIKKLVNIIQDFGLTTHCYMDPIGIYNPDSTYFNSNWINQPELLIHSSIGYDGTVAHHNANDEGWSKLDGPTGNPIRLNFIEAKNPIVSDVLSDIDKLATAASVCGSAKNNELATDDLAFSPQKINNDLENPSSADPSWLYEQVKQSLWMNQNYDFNGIMPDDTGRIIMKFGEAPYHDDIWTELISPAEPSDTLLGLDNSNCANQLLEDAYGTTPTLQQKNTFAKDSYANMIKQMRRQIKYNDIENYLMTGVYFSPTDVNWKSIVTAVDILNTDQFNIWKPSFARWAYKTFNSCFKVLRTDLARSTIPIASLPPVSSFRLDLTNGVLLATAWANKVHVDITCEDLFTQNINDLDTATYPIARIFKNYINMRAVTDNSWYSHHINIPLFAEEESQNLLYHQRLADPVVKSTEDYQFLGGHAKQLKVTYFLGIPTYSYVDETPQEPYTILYSIPSEIGEKGRILHVMNSRVISDRVDLTEIPADYIFKIKIPDGETINNVYLVSPDLYDNHIDPDRDKNSGEYETEKQNFYSNVNDDIGIMWSIVNEGENQYIKITVPQVISYTAVLMEFEEKDSVDAKVIALKFMPNIYQLQYDIDHDNELLKVGYSLDQSKDLTITYTLVFKDEDDKNLDNAWDQLRNTLYGRYEDIEGFSITLDSTNTNIKEIYFDGSWSNNLAYYDPSIAFHYIPIFGFFKTFTGINDFITSDGHLNIYIGTWNHFFSNTQQISGVPDDIWVKIADDSIEDSLFVNKNRQQLEEEYSERLVVSTTCPVDIVLQDPDGLLTYKTGSGIPFSFYNETDINGDGDLDDIVSVNVLKNGIYSITILPQVDAVPIDRFTLAVWANGQQRIIEKNFSLAMIQSTPYEVFSDEANIMITLKPTINFYPDIIDVKSNNKWITCRIELSSDSYVTNIDTGTVVVNDDVFAEWNMTQVGDSNSNGIPDLMVTFNQEILQTILEPGNHVELKVTGELYDGTKFEGVDYVEVISDDTPPRTIKNIGYPKKGEHDEWVTLDTAFNFTATDDFSGINATYYRIWYENSWTSWLKYSNNFTLSGEGKHYLEYYSVDNAGNVEETHNQTHYVNDSCWNSKWQYRKTITIDHTKVQVDLLNFPVLISLKSDCDLAAHAQADGDDLFFTDAQGTKLNHEIELYNCSTGRLVAWVNVTCLSSVKDTVLYLYYGNTQCGSQQNKGGTWNAEYLMVHHMNKPGTIYDSTAHELNAKGCGVTTSSIGKIDSCKYFDNINDRYDFGTPAMLNPELNSWTISLWTKITHLEPYFKMLRKWGCNSGFILYLYNGWGGHNYFKVGDGIKSVYRYWDKSWSDGYWHYLTIVINRNSNKIDLYLDGILHNGKGSGNIAGIGNITSLSSFRLYGGLNGLHDEFTISTTVRSSDWIKTCYINQKNPATFFSIGNQETVYSG